MTYVIEHALLNLVKNKGRNILLGVIIFTIITATVVTLAIYNTTGVIIENTGTALLCAVRVAPRFQTTGGGTRIVTGANRQTGTSDAQTGVGGGQAANDGQEAADGGQAAVGDGHASVGDGQTAAADGGHAIVGDVQTTADDGQAADGGQAAADRQDAVSVEQYLAFAESVFLDGADINESDKNADGVDAVFYLRRPDLLSAFEAEIRSKGLPDSYAVKTDESAFERLAAPVESLNKLALAFLLITLALGVVIMILLSAIAMRERKYEIGVLRAMGMKKKTVALGLWAEIIVITCICFALGLGAGKIISQPVSDSMMGWQSRPSGPQSSSLAERMNQSDDVRAEEVNISVSGATALEIFGISVLLASIAGVISVSRITKSEPIKILMERH
jgi:putative ABC transport system permease protein